MLNFAPSLPLRLGSPALFRKKSTCLIVRRDRCIRALAASAPATILLKEAASSNNLTSNHIDSFMHLCHLLLDENAKYNLTAIRNPDDVIRKHVVDALTLLPILKTESPRTVIDVGTGAGFPGIVLAIARPDLQFTLLDSVRKKTRFHELVIRELGLRNIQSVWARAEDAGQDNHFRERFCIAMARSVAELRVLAELALPFVRIRGSVIAQKSVDKGQTEIKAAETSLKICGGLVERVHFGSSQKWCDTEGVYTRDERERQKAIVVIRKASVTPQKYPRKPGIPKKSPLSNI